MMACSAPSMGSFTALPPVAIRIVFACSNRHNWQKQFDEHSQWLSNIHPRVYWNPPMDESTIVPACKSCVLHLHIKLDAGFAPSMFTLRTGLMVTCLLVPENDRSGNYLELLNVLVCYVFATMTSLSALTYERVRKQQGSVFPINCLGLPAVVGPKTQIRCSAGQANTASAPMTRPVCFLMLCNQKSDSKRRTQTGSL
jgi:hypothetical protein